MFSLGDRLVIRNIETNNEKSIVRFFDTEGKWIEQENPAGFYGQ